MSRNGKPEIRALTGLRGVAALLVVVYHYLSGQRFGKSLGNVVIHGYLAVDVFFVLSGFVLAMSYAPLFAQGVSWQTYKQFLSRRIARVYPLYIAATIVAFWLTERGLLAYAHSGSVRLALLENLFMVQAWGLNPSFDGPGWSISAEWAAYLLFPILVRFTLLGKAWQARIAGVLAVATILALCAIPQTSLTRLPQGALLNLSHPRYAIPVWRCLSEFTLGLLAVRLSATPFGGFLTGRKWPATLIYLAIFMLMSIPRSDMMIWRWCPSCSSASRVGPNGLPAHWQLVHLNFWAGSPTACTSCTIFSLVS